MDRHQFISWQGIPTSSVRDVALSCPYIVRYCICTVVTIIFYIFSSSSSSFYCTTSHIFLFTLISPSLYPKHPRQPPGATGSYSPFVPGSTQSIWEA
jgi:hypothetical protein